MTLKERMQADLKRVFINPDHFASTHTWNGVAFDCVTDEEAALRLKNGNVMDVSWDNHTTETLVYVAQSEFPGDAQPQEHGLFDGKPVRILQTHSDAGMLAILMASIDPKAGSFV